MTRHPTNENYLVYYRVPHSNDHDLVLRKSLEEVKYLARGPDADVYWVCKITKDKRKPKIEQISLDDL